VKEEEGYQVRGEERNKEKKRMKWEDTRHNKYIGSKGDELSGRKESSISRGT